MKQGDFSNRQIPSLLRDAEATNATAAAFKQGRSEQSIYR